MALFSESDATVILLTYLEERIEENYSKIRSTTDEAVRMSLIAQTEAYADVVRRIGMLAEGITPCEADAMESPCTERRTDA